MKHIQALSVLMILFMGITIPGCETFCGKCYCDNMDAQVVPLNHSFDMNFGEVYCNPEHRIRITFDSLHGDSRCPNGMACIWEGNARVHFVVEDQKEGNSEFILNTHLGDLKDTTIHRLRYELIDLEPYPTTNVHLTQDDYTAIVLIRE